MDITYNGKHSICFWKENLGDSGYEVELPKFSDDDFHLVPLSRPFISAPRPNYSIAHIPNSSSRINITDYLPGGLTFESRTGEWQFAIDHTYWKNWTEIYYEIEAYFHGSRMYIALDDDWKNIFKGRLNVSGFDPGDSYTTITVNYDLDAEAIEDASGLKYRVRFMDWTGNVIKSEYLNYGDLPSCSGKKAVPSNTVFERWSPNIEAVNGNIDYVPLYYYKVKPIPNGNISDLTTWIKSSGFIKRLTVSYSDGINTVTGKMGAGDYEYLYKQVTVIPNTEYRLKVTVSSYNSNGKNKSNYVTWIAVMYSEPVAKFVEKQWNKVIKGAGANGVGEYIIEFNSGQYTNIYLLLDYANEKDNKSFSATYTDISLSAFGGSYQRSNQSAQIDAVTDTIHNAVSSHPIQYIIEEPEETIEETYGVPDSVKLLFNSTNHSIDFLGSQGSTIKRTWYTPENVDIETTE